MESTAPTPQETITARSFLRWALRGTSYKLFIAIVLMLAAGRWDWWWGWLYAGIFFLFDVGTAIFVLPRNPGLITERSGMGPNAKRWDMVIMPLAAGLLPLIAQIVAGLDERFGWSADFSFPFQASMAVVVAVGYSITLWAIASNAFFAPVVRIQTERGHTVVTRGPYHIVRHPGYVGAILFTLAMPLMLGSWWSLIPSAAAAILYVIRTALEDRTLQAELPGYAEFTQKTRYRLLPGVW